MKTLKKILPFAKPYHHFVPEFLIYTFLSIIFGLLNFPLLVQILNLLFNHKSNTTLALVKPTFSFSTKFFADYFNFFINQITIQNGAFGALVLVCAIVGISLILSNLFKYLATKVLVRLRLKLLFVLRNKLFNAYLNQDLTFHNNNTTGDSMTSLAHEVHEIEIGLVNTLQVLMRDPFVVISYLIVLFVWSTKLTLFTLVFLPISGIIISSIIKKLKKLNYYHQDKLSALLSFTNESLVGVKQVQSFTSENKIYEKFSNLNEDFTLNSKNLFSRRELAAPVSEVLGVISAIILITFGGYLIINGKTDLTGTQFITYLLVYTQMIQPLKNLSSLSTLIQRGEVAAERIFGIIEKPVTIIDDKNANELIDFKEKISLKNIKFKYQEKFVVNGIDLEIEKGKSVALVGSSGSGKSTLVDLICRFYDVDEGSIEIDKHNIKSLNIKSLREKIALVSQGTFLFNDTIANNISFGLNNVSKEQIIEAAKVANAHEFIINSEKGYDTIVGESGVKLSGGQKQRITIARAVLKNAPILILDEATSALDSESEKLVQQAIENITKNRTSIVVAHRLSTIKNVDEIIVLEHGKIIEKGNHENLIKLGGTYKKLVELQEIN